MGRFTAQILLSLLAFMLGACGRQDINDESGQSEPEHAAGQPLQSDAPWLWSSLTPDQYLNELRSGPSGFRFMVPRLESDTPEVRQIQNWIDRIHKAAIRIRPGVSDVPPPRAVILKKDELNAFVGYSILCAKVRIQGPGVAEGRTPISVQAAHFGPKGVQPIPRLGSCNPFPSGMMERFFAWYQKKIPDCKVTFSDGVAQISRQCLATDSSIPFVAESLAFTTTPNLITVFSGLFKELRDDNEIAAMIAHELAHYYLAHNFSRPDEFNYFYRDKVRQGNVKPRVEASPEIVSIGKAIGEVVPSYLHHCGVAKLHPLAFAALRSALNTAMGWNVREMRQPECSAAYRALQAGVMDSEIGKYPLSAISSGSTQESRYMAIEEALLSCASAIAISPSLPRDVLERQVRSMGYRQFSLSSQARTLADFAQEADAQTRNIDGNIRALVNRAGSLKLGYYTSEEEADDFAVEAMIAAGMDPEGMANLLFTLGRKSEARVGWDSRIEDGMDTCQAMRESGWTLVPRGRTTALPFFGLPYDPHPLICYRIYGVDREMEAHGWTVARQ